MVRKLHKKATELRRDANKAPLESTSRTDQLLEGILGELHRMNDIILLEMDDIKYRPISFGIHTASCGIDQKADWPHLKAMPNGQSRCQSQGL